MPFLRTDVFCCWHIPLSKTPRIYHDGGWLPEKSESPLLIPFAPRQAPRRELRDVDELGRGFAGGGEGVVEHGVAEGAGGGDGGCAGCDELLNTVVADSLPGFIAEERESPAGSAAETALVIARGLDELAGLGNDGAGLVIDVAITAEIARVVKDDFFWLGSIWHRG